MSRYERNKNRHVIRKGILALFFFIVPLMAVVAAFFFMEIYDGNKNIDTQADEKYSGDVVAFKYNFEVESKALYRLELKNTTSLSEADEYIKSIKTKKLNGFILKEEGYKVLYGIFSDMEQAEAIKDSIAKKAEGSITKAELPGFSLKYNDKDNAFIQLVQATDKLIWEITVAKSKLSNVISMQSKADTSLLIEEIERVELKLERYLGYAEKVTVSKEQEALRDSFVTMLKEVTEKKLDDGANYYKIQGSMLNQIEAYRRYSEKLLI